MLEHVPVLMHVDFVAFDRSVQRPASCQAFGIQDAGSTHAASVICEMLLQVPVLVHVDLDCVIFDVILHVPALIQAACVVLEV